MFCKSLTLINFRNISEETVTFTNGTNVLLGMNAQGKTNLLEAICFFALGKSFKPIKDKDAIMFDKEEANLSMIFEDSIREQKLDMRISRIRKKCIFQNGLLIPRTSELIGIFRAVLFCPEHLSLVQDGPSCRRDFLDMAISQIRPVYLSSLIRYQHILKERNRLIKDVEDREDGKKIFDDTVGLWSAQLAKEAARIAKMRLKYTKIVSENVALCFQDMTGSAEKPDLHYVGSAHLEEDEYEDEEKVEKAYLKLFNENHEKEIRAGATLWGIHKDDIEIRLNGKEARFYASQGQQRSLALAMKMAEGEICRKDCGEYPVFLFDDVLSELDSKRREYLIREMKEKQVIMTTCEDLSEQDAHIIHVNQGHFFENNPV
ncbi:MAG: DNA replication/repair protein RecF [Clostridia bacterium]|nr:DNA replication/repair protein RecF [Clostridia bacterium]